MTTEPSQAKSCPTTSICRREVTRFGPRRSRTSCPPSLGTNGCSRDGGHPEPITFGHVRLAHAVQLLHFHLRLFASHSARLRGLGLSCTETGGPVVAGDGVALLLRVGAPSKSAFARGLAGPELRGRRLPRRPQ